MSWEDDNDLPLPQDLADGGDDEPAMLECPSCGAAVVEDTSKCPSCGDWITPVEPGKVFSRRWWYVIAVLLMLYAMFRFVM